MDATRTAFAAWKTADDEARSAEATLRAAWEKYDRFGGQLPNDQLFSEVPRLRAVASERLAHVVRLMLLEADGSGG